MNSQPVAQAIIMNLRSRSAGVQQAGMRLGTGLRLNSAADEPGSTGLAAKLEVQVRSYIAAQKNVNDGASMMQVADDALDAITSILTNMKTLAVQAANGTATTNERVALDVEFQSLKDEINTIALGTTYDGVAVIGGDLDPGLPGVVTASTQQSNNLNQTETLTFSDYGVFAGASAAVRTVTLASGSSQSAVVDAINASAAGDYVSASVAGGTLTLTTLQSGTSAQFKVVSNRPANQNSTGIGTTVLTGSGAAVGGPSVPIQAGLFTGAPDSFEVPVSSTLTGDLGITATNVLTQSAASTASTASDTAINTVTERIGQVGANLSRLSAAESYLGKMLTKTAQAYDRIVVADLGQESAALASSQIGANAAAALLAQAAFVPEQAISLIKAARVRVG